MTVIVTVTVNTTVAETVKGLPRGRIDTASAVVTVTGNVTNMANETIMDGKGTMMTMDTMTIVPSEGTKKMSLGVGWSSSSPLLEILSHHLLVGILRV